MTVAADRHADADAMNPRRRLSVRGRHVSIVLAVAVHALLIAFLFFGVRWQTHPAESVEVELVSGAALPPSPAPPPSAASTPEPVVAPAPPPPPVEKPVAPPPKPEIAIREKPPEKKEKPRPQPAEMRPNPDPFQKLLDQELRQTSAERKNAELANAAAQELAQLQKAQAAAARARSDADYTARIVGKIRGRIPVNALPPGNPVARFAVSQLPSGEVLQVQRLQSSNHAAYDEAIERAVRASSPLPRPANGEVPRDLILTFCPDEARGCK